VDDIQSLLRAGADKVAINTAAVENPELISEGAKVFGRQCIVASIDFRHEGDRALVFTHGGKQQTDLEVLDQAVRMAELGAGEILLTSIDRDGTMEGYDLEVTRMVTNTVDIPVIASGGPGTLQHLVDAVEVGGASAVAVGSLFHFTDQSPIKARSFMATAGVPVRMQA
jgi:cyclase